MSVRLRIHHLLNEFKTGGAEVLVANLAAEQQKAGHEVVVHAMSREGPISERLAGMGIAYQAHLAQGAFWRIVEMTRTLRRERPDVLHLHNLGPAIVGGISARLSRVPGVVITAHHPSFHGAEDRRLWRAARFADRVVACSGVVFREMEKDSFADRSKLVQISNGASEPVCDSLGEAASPRTGVRFITVGRVVTEKDYPTLVQAFAMARAEEPGMELWILGDGEQRGAVENAISEHGVQDSVRLLGLRRNVGFYLRQSDVFVLSSISEGLPVSLLEAMASELPAIVTDVGEMPDVVRSSEAGLVVPKSSPRELAAAMLSLVRNKEERHRMAAKARPAYLAHFTMSSMAAQYERLYGECVAGKRGKGNTKTG